MWVGSYASIRSCAAISEGMVQTKRNAMQLRFEIAPHLAVCRSSRLHPNCSAHPALLCLLLQAELQPYISLAEGLGRVAVSLVAETGFKDINITYSSPRGG